MYKDIGGYDKDYDEFNEMCRNAWSETFNCICIDMPRKKGKNRIFNENTYIEFIPESEALYFFKSYIQSKTEVWKN